MSIFATLNGLIESHYSDSASDSPSAKLFGNYINEGVPSSGARKPHKTYLRQYFRLLERFIDGNERVVTAAGDVTIDATTDDRVIVDKTVPAATNINFPSCAARIAGAEGLPIRIKNRHPNPALYPLTPVLSGGDTIEESPTTLPLDSNAEVSYFPKSSGNWEIR